MEDELLITTTDRTLNIVNKLEYKDQKELEKLQKASLKCDANMTYEEYNAYPELDKNLTFI